MVPSSYLRIYEPLDSMSAQEQVKWTSYIETGARAPSTMTYRDIAFQEDGRTGLIHPLVSEHAYIKRIGSTYFVCPWRVKLRMLVGLLAFRNNLPMEVADAFVPEEQAEKVIGELEQLRSKEPELKANIASAPWHVPLRWFVPFDDSERLITFERGRNRVRYSTELDIGRTRVSKAVEILNQSALSEAVVGAVAELGSWMGEFSTGSLLELDYGSVGELLSDEDLEIDRSAGEVWASLESLEVGDVAESTRRYIELVEWWGRVHSLESAN